jgi:hypothetical protein
MMDTDIVPLKTQKREGRKRGDTKAMAYCSLKSKLVPVLN